MFDKIIAYSIKQKFVVGVLVTALIVVGLYSLESLPIDALPDITNNQVQIITTTPNLATQEVELFITYPIEIAVKSIPEIVELRSVSRFGLSIVTVVFKESVDIYWARSQINEKLKMAEEQIPEEYGKPELAPISTGLGEIFQYTIAPAKGYEDQYTSMDIRSIQDWLIVPQLLGTKGVAEVNTLGGILKEYEVAVNPDRLRSMDLTMIDIYDALSNNNENTGGAYIDKQPYAYFIRSIGMVSSLDDISKIVVKTKNDVPILIRDVATVQYGNTVRYGATTKDGKGEVVNGIVMMLKGENSAEIVHLVKEKLELIKPTLPEGIDIIPYLDRSKLINKAISTVRTNLIEGALIVIFILVLLIGNWRAGLIVASVIPLSLLFAVSLMRLFGVSGNLMSLGAIDFGLIVDGAVIIVEAIVHRLQNNKVVAKLSAKQMDEEVYKAASNIRSSAAFGEIIILIVYLPILALVGIEGKMFRPMAQTVAFAIFGAFILSLTYVPMMSALLLSKSTGHKKNLSDRIIGFFQSLYTPILAFVMRFKIPVLILAALMFIFSLVTFSKLGGEFIPTLSEGDIATHVMIPPGSSLSQEILSTTRAEKLLLENFPEIEQVVSKIGSAEIPTDPMPVEVADVMIILKDKKEWTSASSKEEMFEKMAAVLEDLPGVTTEFSQPIQMRFNELMTGIRSDVGIKIFGDDIDQLVSFGDEINAIVQSISGVEDARAEAVSGLPQITINYDKDKLALYGLNVVDINKVVRMGFAGSVAGVVYEKEQRYDLVVRLAEEYRKDIDNINNLYISLPSGNQIPLAQVADIAYQRGPAQISREGGKRRIVVGFNVRNRDVESVVSEIKDKIEKEINLPVGYYIQYAGQFENLKTAKQRLLIAVPMALALIFILLYFTFHSVKQSILIFTAIPLSAIGGVFALWLRDMPFSISAGIGFIALFGVAVLNGIVLIAYFNQLKKEGMSDVLERIKVGTKVRLRPVIMTAAVASLGFLPMALSTNAGAEVQKPLATVVIGGLLTATILTLLILPILYFYSERKNNKLGTKARKALFLIIPLLLFNMHTNGQSITVSTVEQAIQLALKNNPNISAAQLEIIKQEQLEKAAYLVPKAEIGADLGQNNTKVFDQHYSITQKFNPKLSKVKKALAAQKVAQSKLELSLAEQELAQIIRSIWNDYNYNSAALKITVDQAVIFEQFAAYAAKKHQYGESTIIEKYSAEIEHENIKRRLTNLEINLQILKQQLQAFIGQTISVDARDYKEKDWESVLDKNNINQHPKIKILLQDIENLNAESKILQAERSPDLKIGYFIQSITGNQEIDNTEIYYDGLPRFQGIQLGIDVPIFAKGYKGLNKATETEIKIAEAKTAQLMLELTNEIEALKFQYQKEKSNIAYYKDVALPNSKLIRESAKRAYESGDIGYMEYVQALHTSFSTQQNYVKTVHTYNEVLNKIQFIVNDK